MGIKKKGMIKAKKNKNLFKKSNKNRQKGKNTNNKKKQKEEVSNEAEEEMEYEPELIDEDTDDSSSDPEEEYERVPRSFEREKVKDLLPVKNKRGFVPRSAVVAEEDSDDEPPEEAAKEEEKEEKKTLKKSLVQDYAVQQKCLEELRRKVALLCTSLVEEPEDNIAALKELILMLKHPTTRMVIKETKILVLSLLRVFLDILPSYRIRQVDEKNVKLKKKTKRLVAFEQALVKEYEKYIQCLYELARKLRYHKFPLSTVRERAECEVGRVALRCMCQLVSAKFTFNGFKNLCDKLVPLAIDCSEEEVTSLCCEAFQKVFRADKLGEVSFGLVKHIIDVVKERDFSVPPALLRTFLSLNLREAKPVVEKIDMRKGRKEWQMMSRTQRQQKKKFKGLEMELKEALAYESVENVKKFHLSTLNKIFWVFFHILKDGNKVHLIAVALEGLSKFAWLINLEFFDDLNSVICSMMENGKLTDVEKLHGCYTLFTIMAGQAEELHIDPHRIYCHMYQSLWNLGPRSEVEHFDLTLRSLEFNIVRKRKKISVTRILAFVKRLCTVCLQTPVHGTLGLLSSIRKIFLNVRSCDVLLDAESGFGSGIYLPDMVDPEHCNPHSTSLYELHLLRNHYNPTVRLYAQHILNRCQDKGRVTLPDKLLNSTPQEVLQMFAEIGVENKMDFLENATAPPKKKMKFDKNVALSIGKDIDLHLTHDMLENVNFFEK